MLGVLKKLVTSRKWLVAASAFVIATGVIAAGWDEASAAETADRIVNVVVTLAGLFIGGTALEDAAAKFGSGGGTGPDLPAGQ
ncbi:MAG: hypothetical protein JW909_06280 [Planctomycetes bacterium]|nr:hypothetical protein [Planctomycetota bacterium]